MTDSTKVFLRSGSKYTEAKAVFKKVSGHWVSASKEGISQTKYGTI